MQKSQITKQNAQEIFNEKLYKRLDGANSLQELNTVIQEFLEKYEFAEKELKAAFLIATSNYFTVSMAKELDMEDAIKDVEFKSSIGWNYVQQWFTDGVYIPMTLISYERVLTPGLSGFANITEIDSEIYSWLSEKAKEILSQIDEVQEKNEEVEALEKHLKEILDGNLPYGLTIKK